VFSFNGPGKDGPDPEVVWTHGIPLGEGYYWSFGLSRKTQERMNQMDVLHCHHLGMVLDLARRYYGGPIVYTNHTRYDLYTEVYLRVSGKLTRRLITQAWAHSANLADTVVAPSPSIRDILVEIGVQKPVHVIPNGVVTENFRYPERPLSKTRLGYAETDVLSVYVGRLSEEKNLETLLESFNVARKQVPSLRLLLVGDGRQRAELEQLAADLGLHDRVRFYGETPFAMVPNILAAADIFASASRSEVHPLTAIEAMAAGLPVVAPNAPGFVESVENDCSGILAANPQDLARALIRLGKDAELRLRMGEAGKRRSLNFDIDRTVEQHLALYRQVLPQKARGRSIGRASRSIL